MMEVVVCFGDIDRQEVARRPLIILPFHELSSCKAVKSIRCHGSRRGSIIPRNLYGSSAQIHEMPLLLCFTCHTYVPKVPPPANVKGGTQMTPMSPSPSQPARLKARAACSIEQGTRLNRLCGSRSSSLVTYSY